MGGLPRKRKQPEPGLWLTRDPGSEAAWLWCERPRFSASGAYSREHWNGGDVVEALSGYATRLLARALGLDEIPTDRALKLRVEEE